MVQDSKPFNSPPEGQPHDSLLVNVKRMPDPVLELEIDDIYDKFLLLQNRANAAAGDDDDDAGSGSSSRERSTCFSKKLAECDVVIDGQFSVPSFCAEALFPRLDYSGKPPSQNVIATDVHGETWKFRHVYKERKHLLTEGWSSFVDQNCLVEGDSVVFLKADNGDLSVEIQRAEC